jgi:poly [ADP-ribose] polymerase 10/14/15
MWKSFVSKREVLAEKNAKQSTEAWVFHGTRQTSPADIYSSSDGFNLGFASQGMWGTGLYFAVNSSYSGNGYHHTLPNNQRQMFLVRLLLGEVIDMPSTPALRVPPEMSSGSSQHLGLKVNRYDTVSGETGGSRVYIVYDNNRAYPEYILTFSV